MLRARRGDGRGVDPHRHGADEEKIAALEALMSAAGLAPVVRTEHALRRELLVALRAGRGPRTVP